MPGCMLCLFTALRSSSWSCRKEHKTVLLLIIGEIIVAVGCLVSIWHGYVVAFRRKEFRSWLQKTTIRGPAATVFGVTLIVVGVLGLLSVVIVFLLVSTNIGVR